jgi:hypothetical protein
VTTSWDLHVNWHFQQTDQERMWPVVRRSADPSPLDIGGSADLPTHWQWILNICAPLERHFLTNTDWSAGPTDRIFSWSVWSTLIATRHTNQITGTERLRIAIPSTMKHRVKLQEPNGKTKSNDTHARLRVSIKYMWACARVTPPLWNVTFAR